MARQGTRGQIAAGELLIVVIIVVLLLVLGSVFVFKLKMSNLGKLQKVYTDVEAIKVAKRLSAFPQFSCDVGEKVQTGCVDRLKLRAFHQAITNPLVDEYAFNSFGASSISVTILTGDRRGTSEVVYDHPIAGYDGDTSYYPVLVYDPLSDQYAFGHWNITIYSRGRR